MLRGGGCALHSLGEAWEPHSSKEPGFIVGYIASNVSVCLLMCVCVRVCVCPAVLFKMWWDTLCVSMHISFSMAVLSYTSNGCF